jgi:hypothetical protein
MPNLAKLVIGVIRNEKNFRANNAKRARADAEFAAVKPKVMERLKYQCAFCALASAKYSECHHLDGNHSNNREDNFVAVDTLCHAYHHIGHLGSQDRFASDNMGEAGKTVLAAVPEISASDLNLLQRAIGVAMLEDKESSVAKDLHARLIKRHEPVTEVFGTSSVRDFGAAMATMDDESYLNRDSVVSDLRVVFHADILKNEGRKFLEDFSGLPYKSWENVFKNAYSDPS